MSNLPTIIATPGVEYNVTIPRGTVSIKVSNTSPYDMYYSGYGALTEDWIPAGTEYLLYSKVYDSGNLQLNLNNNRSISPALSGVILLSVYMSDVEVPLGSWPVSIPSSLVTSSGGVTTANNLVNQNNAAGSNVVTMQVSGDTGNSVTWSNDAHLVNGDASHPGSVSFDNAKILSDGNGNLVLASNITVNGTTFLALLQVSSDIKIMNNANKFFMTTTGGSQVPIIQVDASNNTNIFAASGTESINFFVNGVLKTHIGNSGLQIDGDELFFKSGSKVSSLNSFSGTGSGNFSTNLPNSTNIQISFNPCTNSGSSQTIGGTVSQTTRVTTGAGLSWQGTAWQFI